MPREATDITAQMLAIGQTLAQARENAGLSQMQAADKLEIKQPAIAQWEAGSRCPPLVKFAEIARAYKIAPLSLLRKIFEKFPK